ncbi:hypothetical protein [Halorientalis pallida]|uniref:DUF7973 domain-containing protein n=1 Tax=Halorientalis pallida TaxID=2479928 RepID=A0A498L186_9EURY|nr:hypothetical protein EAF64_04670 [Halorientalis pallida]
MIAALSDPTLWIAAFAGGAFGAALGALPAFCFTGIMVIAGEAANLVGVDLAEELAAVSPGEIATGITGSVAFGPVFGPHISFAAGTAAAAYAARRGYMDTDFPYHEAKNITWALGTKPDVLAVGGVFGVLGMVIRQTSAGFGFPWDPIAMGVVLSAFAHRLVFRYPIVGPIRGRNVLDMTPFARGETYPADTSRATDDGRINDGGTTSGRLAIEPWLGHQYEWANVATIGLVGGILGAYIGIATGSPFLGFGISAASLLFLNLGVEQIPVTHHVTLPASTAALAVTGSGTAVLTGLGSTAGLLVGAAFGVVCALFGELFQRVFYAHSDTHVDPPAAAIVFGTFIIAVLALAGIFPVTDNQAVWIPLP